MKPLQYLSLSSLICVALVCHMVNAQDEAAPPLTLNGFSQWLTGHDSATEQIFPTQGRGALVVEYGRVMAHVKFRVQQYGEVSFPIDSATGWEEEARQTDLSQSRFIQVTYQANTEVVLQLRQTSVHGGVHNHVLLPASRTFITRTIPLADFKGGLTPLDLTNVAKFNFALLANNTRDGYAELIVKSFQIDRRLRKGRAQAAPGS